MTRLGHRAAALIAIIMLVTSAGCGAMSSMSLLDKVAFWDREVVPPEILSRHGPTATERLAQIDDMGRRAGKGSASEQQQIADNLARQISVEQDPQIRLHLIQAISRCRVPVAAAVLRAGLDDKDLDVQLAACQALGDWRGPETTALLGEIVGDDSEPLDLRLAAIDALGRVNDPAAALALAPALEAHANPALQFRAVKRLKKLTGLDHGNDLVAWRDHFSRASGIAAAPPAIGPAGAGAAGIGAVVPYNGPAQSPTAQAGWRY